MSIVEMLGPCRFSHWAEEEDVDLDAGIARVGEPVAVENTEAWVQVVAVSESQTKNTMRLLPAMISKQLMAEHGMNKLDIGKTQITAYGGSRIIEAVTSNPATLEGNRPSFVIRNEALALDTPIPTPFGWTTMGELEDGDIIFGDDGKPCTVTKAHPTQEGRRSFEVTFSDGTKITASDGHWWQTKVAGSAAKAKRRTTLEMLEDGRRFMVPRAGARVTPAVDLPVDPYLLGAWLGDGSTGQPNITVGDEDIEELEAQLAARGVQTHRLARSADRAQRIGLESEIRKLACYRDKHIPDEYLLAGTDQRLELLRGLMDTDGCMADGNRAIFVGRERLAHDLLVLLRSLGQLATAVWAPDERSRDGGTWRVAFTPRDIQPFAFTRKAAKVGQAKRDWVSITAIREVESVPVRCISVDSPTRLFQAGEAGHVTSNTHHWTESTNGHELSEVIERNATKSAGGQARALSITNAYDPSQNSVAQVQREAWEAENTGEMVSTGMFYDSIEAPESITMSPPEAQRDQQNWAENPAKTPEERAWREACTRAWLGAIIRAVRGDAVWLDIESIVNAVLRGTTRPETLRRFWFNNITSAADRWADGPAIEAATHPLLRTARKTERDTDQLRLGWIVDPDDPVVMFFDGSKNDDSTALVGVRVEDGFTFTLGIWAKPKGKAGEYWQVPREDVSARVDEAFERFNVVAFWGDPSHTLEDDNTRFWDRFIDRWHQKYKDRLQDDFWAVKTGPKVSSIMWDMADKQRQVQFTAAAEIVRSDLHRKDHEGKYAPLFFHDGHPALIAHLRHARENRTEHGVSIRKKNRESLEKIDLAACLIGGQMLRRFVTNAGLEEEQETGGWVTAI